MLIIIAIAGLIYLFRKNLKFAIASILLVVFNLVIIPQFIGWAAENHVLDSMMMVAIFLGAGLALIFDLVKLIFNKIKTKIDIRLIKNNNEKGKLLKRFQFSKYLVLTLTINSIFLSFCSYSLIKVPMLAEVDAA